MAIINVIITRHAMQRIAEYELTEDAVEAVVRQASPFAPRWPQAAAAIDCTLPADPLVKYFPKTAVVTTILPHGVPLQPRTEVVYVVC